MPDGNTKLLIHCNGVDGSISFTDSSASNHIVTANGNAQVDTAQLKFGTGSAQFDGAGDYLSIPDHADWDFGTGDFTIDFWIRWNTKSADDALVGLTTWNDGIYIMFFYNTDLRVYLAGTNQTFAWVPSLATWYHVAVVRTSGTVKAFVDGTQIGSDWANTGSVSSLGGAYIGQRSDGSDSFDGHIDELRISNTARWTANFTPETAEYNGESGGGSAGSGGSGNTFNINTGFGGMGMFDFGASNIRWLVVGAGTGIYASSNLGLAFVQVATSRTQTWQYFERSKNVLIATTDSYDSPLYWTGSANSFAALLNVSAPLAKHAINFQGFLILLNTSTNKRGFYYEDQNTQLTGDWADFFTFPSTADDEITVAVVLNKKLYVSTRYKLFRVTYVGGNPDWSYQEVKDWGFVPRTVKKLTVSNVGEVIVGLDYNRRLRLFDGSDDRIISDSVENDNRMCDFALQKIYTEGSGLKIAVAEMDRNEQTYKVCLAIGGSNFNTHMLSFSGRTMSFYVYSNQIWQSLAMAESADKLYLMAADSSGFIYMLDTANTDDGVAINDIYESPFYFSKSPSSVSKLHRSDFYFQPNSSNYLYYSDRTDFSSIFNFRERFEVTETQSLNIIKKSVNIPITSNVYQYQLMSSSNTAEPWRLNRTDTFLAEKGIGDT